MIMNYAANSRRHSKIQAYPLPPPPQNVSSLSVSQENASWFLLSELHRTYASLNTTFLGLDVYVGKIVIEVLKAEHIFNKTCTQTVHGTAYKATVC